MGNSIYKPVSLEVGNILKDVQTGKIGLPDLQRPFVWKNDKVRQLLDSMLRGYPIGYIMLWESPVDYSEKKSSIGTNAKTYEAPQGARHRRAAAPYCPFELTLRGAGKGQVVQGAHHQDSV